MTDLSCRRWIELADRAETGCIPDPSDLEWARAHEIACLECATEARFWRILEDALEHPEVLGVPIRTENAPAPGSNRSRGLRSVLRSPYAWLGATAVCAAATFAVSRHQDLTRTPVTVASAPFRAQLVEVHGDVTIGNRTVIAGAQWSLRDPLRTGKGGRVCVRIQESVLTCFDPDSEARLDDGEAGYFGVRLETGRVVSKVGPQPAHRRYRVWVRDGDVTAKGTEFVVAAGSERKGSVQLYEGQLEVRSANGQSRSLLAPSAANLHETVSTLALTDETRAFDEPLRRLVRRHREDSGSVLEISTRPDGAQVSLDDELLGPTPLSVLTNGGHRVTVSKPGYATITEWLEPRFDLPRQRTYELNPTNSETLSPETRTQATQERSATDPKALLSRAQDLRAKGKLRESVGVLQQLIQSHPASAEARVSLVSVGELELIEFGRPARALQAFESYLKAPGALTREARFGQIRALLALGRKEEAERGTRAFLKAYPNSIQAEQLRKRASSR